MIFESTLPSHSLSFESMSPTKLFGGNDLTRSPSISPEKIGTRTLIEEKETELRQALQIHSDLTD